ncbi:MAG TPA: hypothetical protein VLM40_09915, partial [Gemmata sp.]|nr:hypothetical protein [Gemmata sp.]
MRTHLALLVFLFLATRALPAEPTADDRKAAQAAVDRADKLGDAGKIDEAMKELDHAIQLDPKNAKAFRCRGWCWGKKGDWKRSIMDLDEALRLDPSAIPPHMN